MQTSAITPVAMERAVLLARATVLVAVIGGVGRVTWWASAPAVHDVRVMLTTNAAPASGWTLDRLVVDVAACGLLVVAAVLGMLIALNLAGAAVATRSGRLDLLADRVSPRWLRHCVFACCGFALAAPALASAASAHDSGSDSASGQRQVARREGPRLEGLRLPDLPTAPPTHVVTVRAGDTLWSIARNELPNGSTDRAIAVRVDALYAANRRTIGADPNLIFPGQRLITPGGAP